jgi:DNA-binding MltR family transcriptional regulator
MSNNFIKREGVSDAGKAWAFSVGGASDPMAIEFADVLEALFGGNDSTAVIVSMAYMEERIRKLLAGFFVDDLTVQSKMLDPLQRGALSGFVEMVDLAFLLGLVPKETCKTLKTLAHVRNSFAHNHRLRRFEDFDKDSRAKQSLKALMKLDWFHCGAPRAVYHATYHETLSVMMAAQRKIGDQRRHEIQVSDIILIGRGRIDVSKNG